MNRNLMDVYLLVLKYGWNVEMCSQEPNRNVAIKVWAENPVYPPDIISYIYTLTQLGYKESPKSIVYYPRSTFILTPGKET